MTRHCLSCNKEFRFDPYRKATAFYCSFPCRYTGKSIEKLCKFCGKEFRIRLAVHKKGLGKYCSKSCWRKDTKVQPRPCLYCKKTFQPRWNGTKLCAKECANKAQLGRECTNGLKGKRTLVTADRICDFCKEIIPVQKLDKPSTYKKRRFCDARCFGHFIHKMLGRHEKETSIETKVYDALKNRGFIFEKQTLIKNKFYVDAYIPSLNLVIEADGVYWHNLPKVKIKDKVENAFLKKHNYNLLRLSEQEIRDDSFLERIPQVN